jgi:hypothetical protein
MIIIDKKIGCGLSCCLKSLVDCQQSARYCCKLPPGLHVQHACTVTLSKHRRIGAHLAHWPNKKKKTRTKPHFNLKSVNWCLPYKTYYVRNLRIFVIS